MARRKTKKVVRGFSLSKRSSDWIDEKSPNNASAFVDALILQHWERYSEEAAWIAEKRARHHRTIMGGE